MLEDIRRIIGKGNYRKYLFDDDAMDSVINYVFKYYDRHKPEKSAKSTWLYNLCVWGIKDYVRSCKRKRPLNFTDASKNCKKTTIHHVFEPKKNFSYQTKVYFDRINLAVSVLDEKEQAIIHKKFTENMTNKEIGFCYNTTGEAVRQRLEKIYNKLREKLEEENA